MGIHISWQDVPGFTVEDAWRVEDVEALAALAAPCLSEPTSTGAMAAQVKAILRAALMRWRDGGTGARTSETKQAGAFSQTFTTDTREWNSTKRGVVFTADEISDLQKLCSGGATSARAGTTSTAASGVEPHAVACSLVFGATYCSCGVDIAGVPIYGMQP